MTQIQITIDVSPEWLAKNAPEHCAQVLGVVIQQLIRYRGKVVNVGVIEDRFELTPKGLKATEKESAR
jgi:hypothetical protein